MNAQWAILVLLAALAPALLAIPQPPSQDYTCAAGAHAYADLWNTTPLPLGDDDLSPIIAPPNMLFRYFGTDYTSFRVGSNGYILLGGAGTVSSSPEHISHGLAISPFWADLDPTASASAKIGYYWQQGILVVEWRDVPVKGGGHVRMQALLLGGMRVIEFRYGAPSGGGATTATPNTVAISPAPGSAASTCPGSDNGLIAANGSVASYPAGRYLRFSPSMVMLANPVILAPGPIAAGGAYPALGGAKFQLAHATAGTAYSLQLSCAGGIPPYNWVKQSLPNGWSVSVDGVISAPASAVVAGTFPVIIDCHDNSSVTFDPYAYCEITVDPAHLAFTSPFSLPAGNENQPYAYTFNVIGGSRPYIFSSNNLPQGFSLTLDGDLSAAAAAAGTFNFDIDVHDGSTPALTLSAQFSLVVVPMGSPLTVTAPPMLPSGLEGTAYSFSLTASGGQPPYSWSAASLPNGWSVDALGVLSAAAFDVVPGSFSFIASVVDGAAASTNTQIFVNIAAAPPLVIISTALPTARDGEPFAASIVATGGTGQGYLWTLSSGNLPPGLALTSATPSAAISGVPTQVGTFSFDLELCDSMGHVTTQPFTLTVLSAGATSLAGDGVGCSTQDTPGWIALLIAAALSVIARRRTMRRTC